MKIIKLSIPIFFMAVLLTILITSCEKKKIVLKQHIYNGEWIKERAQNCNLHDSVFLDTPDGILFQPGFVGTINNYSYCYDDYYELSVNAYNYGFANAVYTVEFTTGSPSTGKMVIEIKDKTTGQRYIAYSGTAEFTYTGSSNGYVKFCNVYFKDADGNGNYKGTGFIYVDL